MMCGIAGFFTPSCQFGLAELKQMTGAIAHRGPDAEGYFFEPSIGLGHRRLSIMDLSEEANQPMISHCGRYTMVYNGEVYNFKSIARQLNRSWRTQGDSEVVLEAFVEWKEAALDQFNGMFALAIWDQDKQELFLARDRMGIKPLYVYESNGAFCFGSEIKVLKSVVKNLDVNKEAIATFLHIGYMPEAMSFFKNINQIRKGHYLVVSGRGVSSHKWYELENKIATKSISDLNTSLKTYQNLLEESVRDRLMADVSFGSFLSGGIDSSLVTAVACKLGHQRINTFTIGFKNKKNEAPFAKAVAKELNTIHHECYMDETDAIELLPQMLDIYDQPFIDTSAIPTFLVSKMARKEVKMILSGDGGDEQFMGYGSYKWAERLGTPLKRSLLLASRPLLNKMDSRYQRIAQMVNKPLGDRKSHIFSQEQGLFSQQELQQLLLPQENGGEFDSKSGTSSRKLTTSEEQALFDLNYYLPDDLLVKVDRASMANQLEVRVPLLDHRLVEYALNISAKYKLKQGELKWFLKQVLFQYLPKELFNRPKWGFSIPLHQWLKGDLSFLVADYLSKEVIEQCGVVSWPFTKDLLNRWESGQSDYLYNRVWALVILHQFLRRYV